MTIETCGRTLTIRSAPKRVVILDPDLSDMLIDLGVGNRITAQSGTILTTPRPQDMALMHRVPVLSPGRLTNTEALLGAKPDLIVNDLGYRLMPASGGASLPQLQAAGVNVYTATGGCTFTGNGKVSDIFADVANLGKLFGVPSQATALAAKLRASLKATEQHIAGKPRVSVFEFLPIAGQYYSAGGVALDALGLAGGASIFPNRVGVEKPVSPEEISARNPQVMIEELRPGAPIDQRREIASLKQRFHTTDAAKHGRIYFIDETVAGSTGATRTIDGIRIITMFLHFGAS